MPKSSYAIECLSLFGYPCYLTSGHVDLLRTFDPKHATRYETLKGAQIAMGLAQKRAPLNFDFMKIVPHPMP